MVLAAYLLAQDPRQAARLLLAAEDPDLGRIASSIRAFEQLPQPQQDDTRRKMESHFTRGSRIPDQTPISAYSHIAKLLLKLAPEMSSGKSRMLAPMDIHSLCVLGTMLAPSNSRSLRAALHPQLRDQFQTVPLDSLDFLIPVSLLNHLMEKRLLHYHEAMRMLGEPQPHLQWPQIAHELCWLLGVYTVSSPN